jgi:hypothetical protein
MDNQKERIERTVVKRKWRQLPAVCCLNGLSYRILLKGRGHFSNIWCRWKDNIKIRRKIRYESVNWIQLARSRDQ